MPDDLGRPIFKVLPPNSPGKIEDCLDEIYAALVRHGYAISQADYYGRKLIIVNQQPDGPGSMRLIPIVEILSAIPGPKDDPQKRFGIILRHIEGVKDIEVLQ